MSIANTDEGLLDVPYKDFIQNLLPLYTGSQVTIRIGTTSNEYKLPKALLCKQSSYFRATFAGEFQEGVEQSTNLTEEDGVVSTRSFQLLVQWLYLGRVIFDELAPEEAITATIEFVRIADMYKVTGMESLMAERIKSILKAKSPSKTISTTRASDTNTYCLTSQHITSAALLPGGHPVRRVLASAAVEGYLQDDNHKFLREIQDVPDFAADLLREVKVALKSLTANTCDASVSFKDPFSEQVFPFMVDGQGGSNSGGPATGTTGGGRGGGRGRWRGGIIH